MREEFAHLSRLHAYPPRHEERSRTLFSCNWITAKTMGTPRFGREARGRDRGQRRETQAVLGRSGIGEKAREARGKRGGGEARGRHVGAVAPARVEGERLEG